MKKMIVVLLSALLLLACNGAGNIQVDETVETKHVEEQGEEYVHTLGFSLSPYAYDEEGMSQFIEHMEPFSVLRWAGSPDEFTTAGPPEVMARLKEEYGWEILLATQLYEEGDGSTELTVNMRSEQIVEHVKKYNPEYIALGVEVNTKFNDDKDAIKKYANTCNELAQRIREASPTTKVMITFQYEWLLGLRDGLFGAEHAEATWEYLDYFDVDIIGFTTYPCLYYQDPWSIPANYYEQILQHTDKAIAFTEIGWYSDAEIAEWESSPEEQERFIRRYLSLVEILDPVMSVWSFMYGIFDEQPFKEMSMFDSSYKAKASYNSWLEQVKDDVDIDEVYFVSRLDHPEGEIYRLTSDGYIERLTFNERHENNVALSSDGSMLAYHGGDEKDYLSYEIYIMDLESLTERQITDNQVLDGHPDWYPSGESIIYASFRDEKGNPTDVANIYRYDLKTGNQIQLTDTPYEDNDPEVSPDGQMIAFKSTRRTKSPGKEEIFVMHVDGSNPRALTSVTAWQSDHDPSWSSDSKYIVFERFEGDRIWTDIGNLDLMMNNISSLTPWNNYQVDLEGNLRMLTDVEKGDIAFLPVYKGEKLMYLLIDFLTQNEKVIGAKKTLLIDQGIDNASQQYLFDTKHRYTIEYFDW